MGPNVKTINQSNNATPLSNDILKILQGQLDQGAFGTGVGPLQRTAGTATQQYLSSLEKRGPVNTAGSVGDYTDKLLSATQAISNRNTDRSAANMAELYGAAGTRFGTVI